MLTTIWLGYYPRLEDSLSIWHAGICGDLRALDTLTDPEEVQKFLEERFGVSVGRGRLEDAVPQLKSGTVATPSPAIHIRKAAPQPWGCV